MAESPRPEHGGRLLEAARRWGIAPADWLDLSTGINPEPWPVPELPPSLWHRLPEENDGLVQVVREALRLPAAADALPVPGSQAVIQVLPRLRRPCRVGVPAPGYAEHGHAWRRQGHDVQLLTAEAVEAALPSLDVLVWIQPNNPTGEVLSPERLRNWHRRLARRGGWLVVDEAFVDTCPDRSLVPSLGLRGLLVLRSLGKFYGLAGVRGGLLLGDSALCGAVAEELGPWAVSGPARWLMARALADRSWQERARARLAVAAARLDRLLAEAGLHPAGGTHLFRYLLHPRAADIHGTLARQGVLVRLFHDPPALRIGIPGDEADWQRLARALRTN